MPMIDITGPLSQSKQQGFTLVEILVSIVILSFGLLGLAGLQASALKLNRESQFQSTGVLFAREYAELMRNNNVLAQKNDATKNSYLLAAGATIPSKVTKSCVSGKCSANDVALWDREDWLMRASAALPGLKVEVCFDATPFETSGSNEGLPKVWGQCSNSGSTAMIKIGWQQTSGKTVTAGSNTTYEGVLEDASRPAIVLPVAPGGAL